VAVCGAAAVGYLTSDNPHALPAHAATALRVAIILAFGAAAVVAQRSHLPPRMGQVLGSMTLFCSFWMVNGASGRAAFTVGTLASGLAPLALLYVLLAYNSGLLRTSTERWFVAGGGGACGVAWIVGLLITGQPPVGTPLIRCAPRCPRSLLALGDQMTTPGLLKAIVTVSMLAMSIGALVILHGRSRSAPVVQQRGLGPLMLSSLGFFVVVLLGILKQAAPDSAVAASFGLVVLSLPVAILIAVVREHLFMGHALAHVVAQLARHPGQSPETIIAATLHDPTLRIAYRRPGTDDYVDTSGRALELPVAPGDGAVTYLRRGDRPVAAVIYDPNLVDEEPFVRAVAAAVLLRSEGERLLGSLRATAHALEESRRLVDAANAERQRIERDLHDGVQQEIVGLRIKLDLAAEALRTEPEEGERMLSSMGRQMDSLLEELRSLAHGIYPAVLRERGLLPALRSVARAAPILVTVHAEHVGRYPEGVEAAVYFCCLEAIQNSVKHAGPAAAASIRMRQQGRELQFEVRDTGQGFDPDTVGSSGSGLTNMRDRIETAGGSLAIPSRPGEGTTVQGRVPVLISPPAVTFPISRDEPFLPGL
jgi:signal transduction histidine kinase